MDNFQSKISSKVKLSSRKFPQIIKLLDLPFQGLHYKAGYWVVPTSSSHLRCPNHGLPTHQWRRHQGIQSARMGNHLRRASRCRCLLSPLLHILSEINERLIENVFVLQGEIFSKLIERLNYKNFHGGSQKDNNDGNQWMAQLWRQLHMIATMKVKPQ